MAFTYQSVVDLARIPLNDVDKVRVTDSQLLSYTNYGMLWLAKRRPDLFVGQFTSMPTGENTFTDTFQIDPAYVQTVADYATARAETIDDEKMNESRAAQFFQLARAVAPE